jgi:hypothetical protein
MTYIHTNIQTEIKTEKIDLGRYTDKHGNEIRNKKREE